MKVKVIEKSSFHSGASSNRPTTAFNSCNNSPRMDYFSKDQVITTKRNSDELTEEQKQNRFKYNNLTSLSNNSWTNYKQFQNQQIGHNVHQQLEFGQSTDREQIQLKKIAREKEKKHQKSNSQGIGVNHEMAEYKFEEIDLMEGYGGEKSLDYEDFKLQYMVDDYGNYLYQKKESLSSVNQYHKSLMNQMKKHHNWHGASQHMKKAKQNILSGQMEKTILKAKLQSSINPRIKIINEIRDKTIKVLDSKLKHQKVKTVIEDSKNEVIKAHQEMTMEIEKLLRENQVLKKEIQNINNQLVELQNDNENQKVKNLFLNDEFSKCNNKFDNLKYDTVKLEGFIPEFQKTMQYFNTYKSDKIIREFEQLQRRCTYLQTKLSEIEIDNIEKDKEEKQKYEDMNQKFRELQLKDDKRERNKELFIDQLKSQEKEYQNANLYKEQYLRVFNQVIYVYNQWKNSIKVYPEKTEDGGPIADLKDPIQVLKYMEKMISISTNDKLQAYLRKIIVNAHQLQRKFLKDKVNDKFDPDKIFESVVNYINSQELEMKSIKEENKELKRKLAKIPKTFFESGFNPQVQTTELTRQQSMLILNNNGQQQVASTNKLLKSQLQSQSFQKTGRSHHRRPSLRKFESNKQVQLTDQQSFSSDQKERIKESQNLQYKINYPEFQAPTLKLF